MVTASRLPPCASEEKHRARGYRHEPFFSACDQFLFRSDDFCNAESIRRYLCKSFGPASQCDRQRCFRILCRHRVSRAREFQHDLFNMQRSLSGPQNLYNVCREDARLCPA